MSCAAISQYLPICHFGGREAMQISEKRCWGKEPLVKSCIYHVSELASSPNLFEIPDLKRFFTN